MKNPRIKEISKNIYIIKNLLLKRDQLFLTLNKIIITVGIEGRFSRFKLFVLPLLRFVDQCRASGSGQVSFLCSVRATASFLRSLID